MDWGEVSGWIGLLFGLFVAPTQLVRVIRSRIVAGISLTTYVFLVIALVFYLAHALYIQSMVFAIAQASNLLCNSIILVILIRHSKARTHHDGQGSPPRHRGGRI